MPLVGRSREYPVSPALSFRHCSILRSPSSALKTSILFSDEATFSNHDQVNFSKMHYMSVNSPHWLRLVECQRPSKVRVWCGIVNHHLVGVYSMKENLIPKRNCIPMCSLAGISTLASLAARAVPGRAQHPVTLYGREEALWNIGSFRGEEKATEEANPSRGNAPYGDNAMNMEDAQICRANSEAPAVYSSGSIIAESFTDLCGELAPAIRKRYYQVHVPGSYFCGYEVAEGTACESRVAGPGFGSTDLKMRQTDMRADLRRLVGQEKVPVQPTTPDSYQIEASCVLVDTQQAADRSGCSNLWFSFAIFPTTVTRVRLLANNGKALSQEGQVDFTLHQPCLIHVDLAAGDLHPPNCTHPPVQATRENQWESNISEKMGVNTLTVVDIEVIGKLLSGPSPFSYIPPKWEYCNMAVWSGRDDPGQVYADLKVSRSRLACPARRAGAPGIDRATTRLMDRLALPLPDVSLTHLPHRLYRHNSHDTLLHTYTPDYANVTTAADAAIKGGRGLDVGQCYAIPPEWMELCDFERVVIGCHISKRSVMTMSALFKLPKSTVGMNRRALLEKVVREHRVRSSATIEDLKAAIRQEIVTIPQQITRKRHDGNTPHPARRSDEALGVRVSIASIAPSLLELGHGVPTWVHPTLKRKFSERSQSL
ncbi:hypothetical protein PR048_002956 [Dryococelus australis]|uniref:Uncharacterized protein n=1 Tax=Dryococelus australis TaxID=614101 RepID=A0ABQ9IM74_9NEOP|nr:hypothetical protein PR048_002956 [Dryococelus australis]